MRLPKFAVENHHFTIIAVILLVVFGFSSFLTMPRSEDPQVMARGTSVTVIFPGADPIDMEQLIVDPIEKAINELDDIKVIESSIEDGLAIISAEFDFETDTDEDYSNVVEKVNSVRKDLPEEIMSLDFMKWETGDVNILQIALVSETAGYEEIKNEAERLKDGLERVTDVRKVQIWACPEQEVRVSLDLEKLAQMKISLNQVVGAIQSSNVNIPGGSINIGGRRFNIHSSGSYQSLDEIRNTIINSRNGDIIYLGDLADVRFDYEDKDYHARFNGKRTAFITVNQKEETNIFKIMKALKNRIADFEKTLPEYMSLHFVFDQSKSVSNRVNNFFSNLLQGILLVGIVILLGVGFRASIVVILAIPISIFIGLGFVDLSGFWLEQISIAGLVIVLGILVDNAIVVTENISRFLKMGYSHKEAAIKGTAQIGWAIVSATATTIFAFIPIIMMRDITGEFIRSMPVTVVYTLIASLFIALTFTPYLSSKVLKRPSEGKNGRIQRTLTRFIETYYIRILNYSLSHSKIVIVIAFVVFCLSLALFPFIGVSLFPKAEKPQFLININTPEGTSINKTDEAVRYVESLLSARKEIKHYAANIGCGNPCIYYNVFPDNEKSNHAQIFVDLKKNNTKVFKTLIRDFRKAFKTYPGARIEVKELEQGPPVEAPVAIKILGKNLNILKEISKDVETIFLKTPGAINVNNPLSTSKTDLRIRINREKAGILGLNLADIDRAVRTSISGLSVSKYRDSRGEDYDIVLKPDIYDLNRIYVTSITGAQIPLKQVASVEFKSSLIQISHYNLKRSATMTADVLDGYSVDKVTKEIIAFLENYNWPRGYGYYVSGELESREESFGGMGKAIIIAVIAILGVLIFQFKSFSQPLIIFSSIPLAFIGSILALLVTGNSFSFTAFIGLTSLVGIVVNNAIILVDYTNQLVRQGKDTVAALKEAGETRFVPIVLTTATTIGGLLPLTLRGGTLWAPMGWTIIGGLLTSTLLTLIVVPVLYKIFTKK